MKHHHQLPVFRVCEARDVLNARKTPFAHSEAIRIVRKHLPVHLLNECMHPFLLGYKLRRELQAALVRVLIRQARRLLDGVHHVDAEARDAPVHPKSHGFVHLLPHRRVFPVQVTLPRREGGQVVFAGLFILRPRAAPKEGHPVVRSTAVLAGPEIIKIAVGRIGVGKRRPEPDMLIGGVVGNEVHQDADAARLCLRNEAVELRKRAIFLVDCIIVGNIIAVIPVGRGINRRKPEKIHPQLMQIIKLGDHAAKIADAIPVPVTERARPNLVNDFFPRIHGGSSFVSAGCTPKRFI